MGLTDDRPLATGMRDERTSQTTLGTRPLGPSCERPLAHNRSPSRACVVRATVHDGAPSEREAARASPLDSMRCSRWQRREHHLAGIAPLQLDQVVDVLGDPRGSRTRRVVGLFRRFPVRH